MAFSTLKFLVLAQDFRNFMIHSENHFKNSLFAMNKVQTIKITRTSALRL